MSASEARRAVTLHTVAQREPGGEQPRDELVRLADALLDEVRAVRAHWQELDEVLARIGAGPGEGEDPRGTGDTGPDQRPEAGENPAKLMAREMMRSGGSRGETAAYLRETFGLEPDEGMLDEIFEGSERG